MKRKIVELAISTGFPPDDPLQAVFQDWIAKMETESKGVLQVTLLKTIGGSGASATTVDELFAKADWVWGISLFFGGKMPLHGALGSFIYGTDIAGSLSVCNQLLSEFPEMQAEYTALGVKNVGTFAGVGNSLQTVDKAVRTLQDLKGLRIGGASGIMATALAQLGAVTTGLPAVPLMGQEYTAFAKYPGQFDGILTLPEFLTTFGGDDVVRYSTYLHLPYATVDLFLMKLEKWNSLPQNVRNIMEGTLPWFYDTMTKTEIAVTEAAITRAKAKGVQFFEFSQPDLNTLYGLLEKGAQATAAALDAKGLPGTKIFERARQLIAEYESKK